MGDDPEWSSYYDDRQSSERPGFFGGWIEEQIRKLVKGLVGSAFVKKKKKWSQIRLHSISQTSDDTADKIQCGIHIS